jgi:Ca2+-binding EF-hand superfamily protein
MKNSKIVVSALIFVGSWAAHAYAGNTKPGGSHEITMMDTNADGKISPDEHAAGAAKMFETMDVDKDGKVTASEMSAAHGRVTGKKTTAGSMSSAEKIKVIDGDGDGTLTAAEHAAGSRMMFERMDVDRDAFVTAAELAAGHSTMLGKQ